ncbi:NUDIX hydrolase [Lewinella sp. 4G2]|uniref:NUDIX domain-containing protein n=1 Tax=Lewinella sp. 4G2 TaxID=1803372 RepID=UPI0007B46641|nr:NUDIX hydrolase [Lewinella sp. 4G2]OAV46118.1 DNA mismatch repair protein MutT [Lewinella sp. 4G2]
MKNPWTTLTTTVPYDNPWISVEHNEVLNPAGNPGIYGVVRFKNQAIGIVPIDEDGYTYLVGQYRFATGRYEWEIPEGGCPVGTDPLATAQRELKEETGLVAEHWTQLMDFYLSNSVTDEYGVAYVARGLRQEAAEPEDTEELKLKRVPLQEAIDMTLDGRIKDALSVLALQRVGLLGARPI